MAQTIHILVADADASIRDVVALCAAEEGWRCHGAPNGIAALKMLRREEYQLVVLDTDLPEVDGHILCSHLRKSTQIPVLFISKNGKEDDRLAGFAVGGNDYVLKPFYPRELQARMKNLLSLCAHRVSAPKVIEQGQIRIELDSHGAFVDGHKLQLAPKEYDLLLFFLRNAHRVFSRDEILDLVWGESFFGSDRTVDTHVKSLRGKIRPYQNCIETVWGLGYKFEP